MTPNAVEDPAFDHDVIEALAAHMESWQVENKGYWTWTDASQEILHWYRKYYKTPQVAVAFRTCELCNRAFTASVDDPSFICDLCKEM